MGFFKVLKDLKELIFSSKRNVILTLIMGIVILAIPVSLRLIESQKIIKSRADEPEICETDPTSIDCRCNNSSLSDDWDPIGATQCSNQCNLRLVKYRNVCEGNREQEFAELYDLACTNGCTTTSTPPPGTQSPPPVGGVSPAPAGQCTLSHRAAAPVLTSSCASCIIGNAPGAISFIRGVRGNEACTVEDAVNHWCNGGVEGGQANCTDIKNVSCNIACGSDGGGVCNLDSTRMTVSPEQARPGERVTFTVGGVGVTWIEDEFGGGARDCSYEPDATNSRYIRNCIAGNNPGNYTWLHKWGPSERAQKCGKPQTYTILAATTNNAACGTFKVNNSTDQATVTAGSQFDVSLIMNNPTGSKTWKTSENYRLAKVDGDWALPDENRDRVRLPSSEISAGNTATFNFRLTVPNTAGSFPLNLRMVQDGVQFFGATCSKNITVGAAVSSPSPSPSPRVSPSPAQSPRTSPSPQPPVAPACIRGDLDGNRCISPGFTGNDFQTWLRVVTGQDSGKADVFPPCAGDGKVDINDFNLWLVESLAGRNRCPGTR